MTSTIHQHSQGHYPKVYAAAVLLALILLVWSTSCKKDPKPTPTPEIPTDTIVPEIPNDSIISGDTITPGGDTIVIPGKTIKFFYDGGNNFPPLDSISRYANDQEYDTIYIKWTDPAEYWTTYSFYVATDSLKRRFDISPKVFGLGTIKPYEIRPDSDSLYLVKGMIQSNRSWLESHNYVVQPVIGDKKSNQPPRY